MIMKFTYYEVEEMQLDRISSSNFDLFVIFLFYRLSFFLFIFCFLIFFFLLRFWSWTNSRKDKDVIILPFVEFRYSVSNGEWLFTPKSSLFL